MAEDSTTVHDRFRKMIAEVVGIIIVVFLLIRALTISGAFRGISYAFDQLFKSMGLLGLYNGVITTYLAFAVLTSTLFIIGIIYSVIQLRHLEIEWRARLYPQPEVVTEEYVENERWRRVLDHISSENSGDWRLAILECDIILDELLDRLGYTGSTIGDKLKNVNPAYFRTLNNAWEAHKIRNAIAHEGQDFTLTQREARRIIALYESVFREFDFIKKHAPVTPIEAEMSQ